MSKKAIESHLAPSPIGPYSQAIVSGNMLFCSGMIALDANTGNLINENITIETIKVMENLKAVLSEARLTFDEVVKCSIFLKSMDDFYAVNEVYSQYFQKPFPARETVEVSKLPKNVAVEISLIAMYS